MVLMVSVYIINLYSVVFVCVKNAFATGSCVYHACAWVGLAWDREDLVGGGGGGGRRWLFWESAIVYWQWREWWNDKSNDAWIHSIRPMIGTLFFVSALKVTWLMKWQTILKHIWYQTHNWCLFFVMHSLTRLHNHPLAHTHSTLHCPVSFTCMSSLHIIELLLYFSVLDCSSGLAPPQPSCLCHFWEHSFTFHVLLESSFFFSFSSSTSRWLWQKIKSAPGVSKPLVIGDHSTKSALSFSTYPLLYRWNM